MTPEITRLSAPEQQQAYQLWDALMFAPTQTDFDDAREQLRAASELVRSAIISASIYHKTHEKLPRREENPFV